MITERAILDRLETLQQERQMLVKQMATLEPKIVAYDGAIEDCQFWLNHLREALGNEELNNG